MIKYREILTSVFNWFKSKLSFIIIAGLVVLLLTIVLKGRVVEIIENDKNMTEVKVDKIEDSILEPLPPAPKKKVVLEQCEPNYVLKTDDILKQGNFIVLDLATFENFKTKRIDNKRVGYYYRRSGATKEYYTIFKNEPLLKLK